MAKTEITEDYVSFETAQLLKQKGFAVPVKTFYNPKYRGEKVSDGTALINYNADPEDGSVLCSAPTLQMACKWLREVHEVCVYCYNTNSRVKQYGKYEAGASWIKDDVSVIFHNSAHSLFADTYEEAVESVIRYCLTNIID